jgi:phage anti-repressor protein
MRLNEELKKNEVADYIAVNYLYGRTHEIVSQMNEDQLRIINENYPELITIAQRIGKANSMRTSFLKEENETATEQD